VCAGDISTSSDFEIVNPELHLATLDQADSRLSIEFNVEQGVGYQQAVQSDDAETTPVGVLPVDAIFSPVTKVNYNVGKVRVGEVTDYERLVLEVWTDGTIKPVDAVREAAENLVNHFFMFSNLNKVVEPGVERSSLAVSPETFQLPIDRLELSPRTLNCLKRAHITKVGEILELADDDLLKIRNFGEKSLVELREKLAERGIGTPGDGSPGVDGDSLEGAETAVAETAEPFGAGETTTEVANRELPGNGDGWGQDDRIHANEEEKI